MTTQSEQLTTEFITGRKLQGIEKFIIRAEEEYTQAILKNQYGIANQKLGLRNGLKEGKSHLTYKWTLSIDETIEYMTNILNHEIANKNWGKCEYWDCYISGLNVCKSIIEG